MLSPQEALVYTMVVAAEADHEIADAEINLIGDLGNHLPVFRDMNRETLTGIAMGLLPGSGRARRPRGGVRPDPRVAATGSCAAPPMRSPAT